MTAVGRLGAAMIAASVAEAKRILEGWEARK